MIAKLNANGYISIHALLAESDIQPDAELYTMLRISIHALLAESDFTSVVSSTGTMDFYPRSPCGERQLNLVNQEKNPSNFYPRSPCGERPRRTYQQGERRAFLSTLSLRRATANFCRNRFCPIYFYPRSPCGERQGPAKLPKLIGKISIHALLAESDRVKSGQQHSRCNFYPRSPCGERQPPIQAHGEETVFLSTLSLRRATPMYQPTNH